MTRAALRERLRSRRLQAIIAAVVVLLAAGITLAVTRSGSAVTTWTDVLSPSISWDDMSRGTGLAVSYAAVFLAVAWLRFDRKDITS